MKTHQKLKTPPRTLFTCGIFRHCTQSVLSPRTPPPIAGLTVPTPTESDPPPKKIDPHAASSSSSSSSTSQSFTQWRFSLPQSPYNQPPPSPPLPLPPQDDVIQSSPPITISAVAELYHVAELQFSSRLALNALNLLERSLVPNPLSDGASVSCPPLVLSGVVALLGNSAAAKPATKVLLALCLPEVNRRVAVEVGAVSASLEVLPELSSPSADRVLAALELMCTVEEGAEELRSHPLTAPVLVEKVGQLCGRGKEYAVSVLSAIYSSTEIAPPPVVARAVMLALQGECSARCRRKGGFLLKSLRENGRLDLTDYEN